uniref:succinate:cytochrome c oxidoreductase subunit 4 n=1 Tax=Madagascaria erythrocladioides TaxID=753684 RepID=UPI001FCCDE27|nr:succinate:cytochrome c oxidoreductase subunit 4 [Madagascaria erythrocladioides]UNJ18785.1 succinate:cytochrome c oxidoreductase subunit 4 [Madagascaria erythrocladioides]
MQPFESKNFLNIYLGWIHWWLNQLYSLVLLSLLLTFNIALILNLQFFFFLHYCLSFEIILEDYLYIDKIKQLLLLFLRYSSILVIWNSFLFFI